MFLTHLVHDGPEATSFVPGFHQNPRLRNHKFRTFLNGAQSLCADRLRDSPVDRALCSSTSFGSVTA